MCKVERLDILMNFSLYCNCKHNVLRINITHTYLCGPVPKCETIFLHFHIKFSFICLFIYLCVVCLTPLWHLNPLNPELNPICYLLALLGAHHFLHVSRIRVKLLTFRLLMSYIYGAPIFDVSRSHTTTQHSR